MLVLTVLCGFLCFTLSSVASIDPTSFRLPNHVVPLRYDIALISKIHIFDTNFSGFVKIVIQVLNDTNEVVIHQQDLNISTVLLFLVNEDFNSIRNIPIKNTSYVGANNFFIIETNLNEVLLKGEMYLIQMNYVGILNSQPIGFYAAPYLNELNETVLSAMSQLKPIHAKQMFPCLDEPQFKAIFGIQITHGHNITAISNMPSHIVETSSDLRVTQFLDTPPMSTYAVSLILSNLTQIITKEDANGIVHQVYSSSSLRGVNQLGILSDVSQKVLPTFISTLGVNYSLPQLIQAVYIDSSISATSSLGVITYSDSSIYFDSIDYSYQQQEIITKQISQEISKQFFGNLISPEWWNSNWLIDGLISVSSNLVLSIDYPNYRVIDDFLINVKLDTMAMDWDGEIPILEYDIDSFDEITKVVSANTRSKASCIIYMMMHAIQEELFHKGLKEYLIEKENSTISTVEFFARLDTLARDYETLSIGTSLSAIIKSWTSQKGLPILTVQRDYASGLITLIQTNSSIIGKQPWAIPYNFIVKHESKLDAWLTSTHGWLDQQSNIIQPSVYRPWSSTDWILFNKKSTGYYRVNYDRLNWELLTLDLNNYETFPLVHYLNRAQLIDDSFFLAKENLLSYQTPLYLALFLQYETEHFVWQSFYRSYQFLERILFDTDVYGELATYIKSIAGLVYDNFERKSYHDVLTQKILINLLCQAGHSKCVQETSSAAMEFINNGVGLPQYFEKEYLHNGIRFVGVNSINTLFTSAMSSNDPTTRFLILSGLGCITNLESIQFLMKATITENNQTIGDISINLTTDERKLIILSIINNNHAGFKFVMEFLRIEQEQFRRMLINEIPAILESISYRIGTIDSYARLLALVDLYKNLQNQVTLNKYLENAKINVEWLNIKLIEIRENLLDINSNAITLSISFSVIIVSQVIIMFKMCV